MAQMKKSNTYDIIKSVDIFRDSLQGKTMESTSVWLLMPLE